MGRCRQLRRPRQRRRARVGDPERVHVGARLPHRRPARGRRARDPRRGRPPPAGRALRARRGGERRRRGDDRRERPQRPARRARARPGRVGLRRPVVGRLPPRPARPPHRRARRLLRRLTADLAALAAATGRPFVYEGGYSAFRRRRHGAPDGGVPAERFVVCSQNHDQIGNRALGERPPLPARGLAAMWVLLSPFTPMLFMGEEHGETRPFLFFTDHIDPFIADATREGRRSEFAEFAGFEDAIPDPQDPETFARSVIDPAAGDPAMRAPLPGADRAAARAAARCGPGALRRGRRLDRHATRCRGGRGQLHRRLGGGGGGGERRGAVRPGRA